MTSRTRTIPLLRPLLPPFANANNTKTNLSKTLNSIHPTPAPALPFFRDPAHTIPTKWTLFRSLLRSGADFPAIARYTKAGWRRRQGWTSVPRVRRYLEEQYELLARLEGVGEGKEDDRRQLASLEFALAERHRLEDQALRSVISSQEEAAQSPRPTGRLTGAFHRPTLFNPPLPRLKPQPASISMMIHNRLRARERRMARRREYASLLVDMKMEQSFWREMDHSSGSVGTVKSDWTRGKDPRSPGGWDGFLSSELKSMDDRFSKENRRADMKFEWAMMDRVARAKTRRQNWRKQVAKEKKELRGETSDAAIPAGDHDLT